MLGGEGRGHVRIQIRPQVFQQYQGNGKSSFEPTFALVSLVLVEYRAPSPLTAGRACLGSRRAWSTLGAASSVFLG